MKTAHEGQRVMLKPQRADAYGMPRGEVYEVTRTFQRSGYAALWCELAGGGMRAPLNRVKASELRSA